MNSPSRSSPEYVWYEMERQRSTAVQDCAAGTGWMLMLFGVMGFVPLATPGFSGISFAGADTAAELFGVFSVSVLSNLIHLLAGVIGLVMSFSLRPSHWYLLIGGVCFVLLGIHGLLADAIGADRFLPANLWTVMLHLGLGIVMIALGFALTTKVPRERNALQ